MVQVTITAEDELEKELRAAIGVNLRRYRKLAKLKQDAVAREVGYASHSSITNIERGNMLPSLPQLVALARAVHAPLDGMVATRPFNDTMFRDVAVLAQRLSPAAQAALVGFLLSIT